MRRRRTSRSPRIPVAPNPGDLVGFPDAPPRVEIFDRSYALSTVGVPMIAEGDYEEFAQESGAQIIDAGGNPWRYVWFMNQDDGELSMYRWSDGDWKVSGNRAQYPGTVQRLMATRQLNVVDDETFAAVDDWMRERYEGTVERVKEWASELEGEQQKQVNALVFRFLDEQVMPEARRMWAEIDRGVYPFDFEYNANIPKSRVQQAKMHAMHTAMNRMGFAPYDSDLERFVLQELRLGDIDEMEDMQAIQWAVGDAMDAAYGRVPGAR